MKLITLEKYFQKDFYCELCKDETSIIIVLKAFWNDEGMVGFYKNKQITRKLRARCQNTELRKQLLYLHKILGIEAHEEYDKKGIIITDKESIEKFSSTINFTNNVKVVKSNGMKSVWKGCNKTDILNLLLSSYEK